jgi:hypothetical protein
MTFSVLGPWSPPVNIKVNRAQYIGELYLTWDVSIDEGGWI